MLPDFRLSVFRPGVGPPDEGASFGLRAGVPRVAFWGNGTSRAAEHRGIRHCMFGAVAAASRRTELELVGALGAVVVGD